MPRTFDRRRQLSDKDPRRFGTNWSDPQGAINESASQRGLQVRESFPQIIKDIIGVDLAGFNAAWQSFVDGVVATWTGITETVGKAWEDAVAAIEGIFDTGKTAKLSADNANIGVEKLRAQLSGGGWDEFDYESSNALPSSLYEVTYGGAGAGYYGPNGSGYLVWKPSGGGTREVICRRTDTSLSEDNGVVTVVWAAKPYKVLTPKSYGYILGRCSLVSNDTFIRAKISDSGAAIEAVVSGTVTSLGSQNLTVNDGDVFELWFGYTDPTDPLLDHPRRFWLKQNGTTVLTVDDGDPDGTGSVSEMGSGFRQNGIGCLVSNYLVLFQNPAPSLAGWTWALQPTGGA